MTESDMVANWYMGADWYRIIGEHMILCDQAYREKDVREYWHAVYNLYMHCCDLITPKQWGAWDKKIKEARKQIYQDARGDRVPDLYDDTKENIKEFYEQIDIISDIYVQLHRLMFRAGWIIPKKQRPDPETASLAMEGH